ncbi:MAG: hypothetical protein U1E05_22885, partial [Patescibacteria group bacterium]|nr:hypothetical protein [Patescibacteria group bacterium]
MKRRLLVTLVLTLVLAGSHGIRTAAAQDAAQDAARTAAAGGSEVLRFRRVLAPAASREDWPLGQQKYLPIGPADFEKLLSEATAPVAVANRSPVAPRISQAEYAARLDGNRLIEGSGLLWVEHASETRSLMRLDPCGLAVSKAFWADEDPRPAILGLGVGDALDLLV